MLAAMAIVTTPLPFGDAWAGIRCTARGFEIAADARHLHYIPHRTILSIFHSRPLPVLIESGPLFLNYNDLQSCNRYDFGRLNGHWKAFQSHFARPARCHRVGPRGAFESFAQPRTEKKNAGCKTRRERPESISRPDSVTPCWGRDLPLGGVLASNEPPWGQVAAQPVGTETCREMLSHRLRARSSASKTRRATQSQ